MFHHQGADVENKNTYKMEITYSKRREQRRPPYINFRMRKLICEFINENANEIYSLNENERAQYIANNIETIVSQNFWIKRKDIQTNKSKAA